MVVTEDRFQGPADQGGLGAPSIDTVVVDYGGVLTNPLVETLVAFAERVGLSAEAIADAFMAATQRYGNTPMAALEVGEITERQMAERLLAELPPSAQKALAGRPFGELWFQGRTPNQPFLDFLRELRAAGYRLVLLTNNVREWEQRWRAQIPVDELFELVVNSAHEGVRKPQPEIYQILFDRLGVSPARCLFVDDTEENCRTARELGMRIVWFVDTATVVREIREILDRAGRYTQWVAR